MVNVRKPLQWLMCILILTVFVFPFVLATPSYSTWVADKDCPNECIEGRSVNFDVTVKNKGSSTFIVEYVEVRDRDNTDFAWKSTNKAIATGEQVTIEDVDGWLPPPTSGSTLYYKICFYMTEEHWYGDTSDWYCSSEKDMTVSPAADIECDSDWGCAYNQQCVNHKCSAVTCGHCEYIESHGCSSYDCCDDSDCFSNEKCVGHSCEQISCSCGYIQNHKCINYECCADIDCDTGVCSYNNKCVDCESNYDCSSNEYCSGSKCISYECTQDSDCNDDQYCYSNNCETVWCDDTTQYISNHECSNYECVEDWECMTDEYCLGNKCENLVCDFGYSGYHKCNSYFPILLFFLIVIIAGAGVFYHRKKKKSKSKD